MNDFNPFAYVESIKGKPYLPTQHRIAWFRHTHPGGAIITNPVEVAGVVMIRAEIYTGDHTLLASGMATIRDQAGQTWTGRVIEKAETAAIARALAHAGFEIDDKRRQSNANRPQDRTPTSAPETAQTGAQDENPAILKTSPVGEMTIKRKDANSKPYAVIAGVTFFSGELLRAAGFDMTSSEWKTPGRYPFPDGVKVVVGYHMDGDYKVPASVEIVD